MSDRELAKKQWAEEVTKHNNKEAAKAFTEDDFKPVKDCVKSKYHREIKPGVWVDVYGGSPEYDGDVPTNLIEFQGWIKDYIESIPVEFRSSAEIEFKVVEIYGDTYSNMTIHYADSKDQ